MGRNFIDIVIKEAGGKSGGKSSLTEYGKKIVKKFKTAEECFMKFSEDEMFDVPKF